MTSHRLQRKHQRSQTRGRGSCLRALQLNLCSQHDSCWLLLPGFSQFNKSSHIPSQIRQSIRGSNDLDVSDRGQVIKPSAPRPSREDDPPHRSESCFTAGNQSQDFRVRACTTLLIHGGLCSFSGSSNLDVVLPALATWPSSSPDSRKCDSTSTASTRSASLTHSILTRAY